MPVFLVPADYPQLAPTAEAIQMNLGAGGVKETTLGNLLPDSFGPDHLESRK